MPLKLLIVMDDIRHINIHKDSSIAMLWAAAKRGFELYYAEQQDVFIRDGRAFGHLKPLTVFENTSRWFEWGQTVCMALSDMNVILMRKDPPFDMRFIYTTYILERAEQEGVLVVNKPQSLRDCNEKLFATQFAHCMVPTLVSSQMGLLKQFIVEHNDVIVKPLDGMGGAGIFRLQHGGLNIGATLETLTEQGSLMVMAQRYIPEIVKGDKRILVIDGVPIPFCLARVPQQGETRGNLAAGGSGVPQLLSPRDYWLVNQVSAELKRRGLIFVGLDVIGDYITEINVTSPTCIREIDKRFNVGIADKLMQVIEQKISQKRG
ncbi:glutathione synthase [Agitococcus lubricus]|uniref:Glutathione synthetase n=1 Tax=Agitococcus lubricus TaxID=1077255 RepID=A0A2T5J334_9GAMM|nr:glutathione synthase [Agitococcus lubricus]PTQ91015.1 glutathione synthase [Agitococcus lubricus]